MWGMAQEIVFGMIYGVDIRVWHDIQVKVSCAFPNCWGWQFGWFSIISKWVPSWEFYILQRNSWLGAIIYWASSSWFICYHMFWLSHCWCMYTMWKHPRNDIYPATKADTKAEEVWGATPARPPKKVICHACPKRSSFYSICIPFCLSIMNLIPFSSKNLVTLLGSKYLDINI